MSYQYPITPYVQSAMAQAMGAIMTSGSLPSNCVIIALPIEQAQHMFPQIMMNYVSGGGALVLAAPAAYYGQLYQSQPAQYTNNPPSTAVVPYSNYYPQNLGQNYNYPVVPYSEHQGKSKQNNRHGKRNPALPHSNVYNSSSFDTMMENLSWSRLFDHHHHRRQQQLNKPNNEQSALDYVKGTRSSKDQQHGTGKPITISSTSSSSSITSDETIRRVTVSSKPPSDIPTSKQQIKGSLPFKYSSDFVPANGQHKLQKSHKQDLKVRPDDVFIVKKTQPSTQK